MRKIILFITILCLFLGCSCNCNKQQHVINFYDEETEWTNFLDMFYTAINTEDYKYAAFDLRTKENYETEHLRQLQNYDISKSNIQEFISYLSSNYSKKYVIYIYIESLDDLTSFDSLLDKFNEIHIYIGNYDLQRNYGEELFIFDSGPYNCNC